MGLTAADVMSRDVITTSPDTSVGDLVQRLREAHVSGAPVLGSRGEALGVVSLTDVAEAVDALAPNPGARDDRSASDYYRGPALAPVFAAEPKPPLSQRPVADIMTPYVIDVPPELPIAAVCRRMCDMHLHRVLVTDHGRLCGVVSALDILRAVADGRLRPETD